MTTRRRLAGLAAPLLLLPLLATAPADAVSADLDDHVVSAFPKLGTPHVMDGSVQAMTQIGSKIYVAGTFTKVSPSATFADTSDDLTRNGMFAFDATTGVIDPTFNPNFGNGTPNSLDTDGTYLYVAGSFGSVGGVTGIKRVAKLDVNGVPVKEFKATPNKVVNEVVYRNGRLYIGGAHTSVKSRSVTYTQGILTALDPVRGTPLTTINQTFAGVYNPSAAKPGATNVKRFDVSPDGSRLVAIGNFATVNGQARNQVVVLDTSGATATLAPWATNRFDRSHSVCAGVFDTFTRDLDISPDGSFFVISTTGAFAGGANANTMCDTTSRWEMSSTSNDPSWIDYTGGDTTYGVAVTGDVVYVGGHMRWENNPYQGDQAGPGAVSREGVAALDAVNGLPLSWNPGRDRGVGAQALFATSAGLWVGSDTTLFANQRRGRIAFMPLAGGTTLPSHSQASLPGDLVGAQSGSAPANVVYRINAGSTSSVTAPDGGPAFGSQTGRVTNGANSTYSTSVTYDSTMPDGTPSGIFASERYGNQDWNFPVTAGRSLTVRLYFANQYASTSAPGQRVFDVLLEGATVLDDFDVAAAAGNRVATMRQFSLTSDGNVDLDLRNVTENAMISGIEILDNNQPGATTGGLVERPLDGSGAPNGAASTLDATENWASVRGAFLLGDQMYYGRTDNALYKRSFDPATGALGAPAPVDLHDDPDNGARIPFAISTMTGMFYDPALHRIYYTVSGDSRLFYRYFTPESDVVGALTFVADAGGVNFSSTAGLALADGKVLYGSSSDGALRSVAFSGGRITGSPTVLSSDGSWKFRGMFVAN
ncbi:hypothetical protein GCM10009623_08540 [Nocardioides aestuarii]|uniref:Malectin domain-containing carbohydrate-binding protein n=1 Tax=Nocardioides aestuarii TaxID=252231 RepID=A0ABW4THH1_9ACTN